MAGELAVVGRVPSGSLILTRLNALGAVGAAFDDSVFAIKGSSDGTKKVRFEVDGLTTATTRVVTVPDANLTLSGSASALTSGRVPFATTGGLLTDSTNLTYGSGKLTIADGTASTSTTTGTLVVTGGTGISGALWVGGLLNVAGATTLAALAATTISASGQITSTVATGTAPLVVASTTVVGNLNASLLLGSSWAIPGSIGATTPAAGAFTTLTASGATTLTASTASSSTSTGALVVTGGVGIGGVINAANNTDGTHVLGRASIGSYVASNTMGLSHFACANTTDFCINQSAAGTTNFNAKAGQNCIFTIGGASKMTLNTSSLVLNTGVPLTVSDTTASTTTGTGALIVGGGGGFAGQVNALNVASRHAGSGSWTGTAYSGTDYSASDTASAPFFRAINTNAGGYDSGFIAYQSTSTGVIKPSFLFGCVGTGAWTNGTVSSQTSDLYVALRDNADALIERLRITNLGNVIIGNRAALATNATDGHMYMPTCAGTPTGVPTAYTGKVAHIYDTTNNKLYVYNGGWKATAALT